MTTCFVADRILSRSPSIQSTSAPSKPSAMQQISCKADFMSKPLVSCSD